MRRGYTLVELLLTVALISILAGISTAFYARFINQNGQANTIDRFVGGLRKAKTYAMSGKANSNWGAAYSAGKIYVYRGNSFGTATFMENLDVPGNITLSGLSDVNFTRITGATTNTGTISITGNNTTKTITINSLGVASD